MSGRRRTLDDSAEDEATVMAGARGVATPRGLEGLAASESPLRATRARSGSPAHGDGELSGQLSRTVSSALSTSSGPSINITCSVSWTAKPDLHLAQLFDTHQMAVYTDTGLKAPQDKKILDQSMPYTYFDGTGDLSTRMQRFGLWSTTEREIGMIGGVGYEVYFQFLGSLRYLFLALALLNTPALLLNLKVVDSMYDDRNLTDLDRRSFFELPDAWGDVMPGGSEPWGPRGTLGTLRLPRQDVENGDVP